MKQITYFLLLTLLLNSCASSRFVEPLDKNQKAVGFNVGGPVIDYGAPIPIPLSSLFMGVGIDSNCTVYGGIHTTSLLFGNIQLDAGIMYKFIQQNRFIPSVTSSFTSNFIYDLNDFKIRFWPQLDLNSYWNFGSKNHFFYLGISNWFELRKNRVQNQSQIDRWLINPQIGLTLKTKQYSFNLECKILAPSHNSVDVFVPYKSFSGGKGAYGVYLGVIRKF